ncbi:RNA polymerase sigma factor [Actinoallomurus sp. CA-150999]|uniref:RNA polymerase sigma factor n=1 Tax=Actinoallomurus sp. CA-150999 TaxID=3239887 RepID=UPI003D90E82D
MTERRGDEDVPGEASEAERQKATRRFYLEHHPRLRRFVARRVGGLEEAEDVCQEVWQSVFATYFDHSGGAAMMEERAALALILIARRRIADFWRRRGRVPEHPVEGEDLVLLADSLAPILQSHHETDRRIDLQRALVTLPSRQREALHLRYVDDLTTAQTATVMGVTDNTVKMFRKRALETLRKSVGLDSYRPEGERE